MDRRRNGHDIEWLPVILPATPASKGCEQCQVAHARRWPS